MVCDPSILEQNYLDGEWLIITSYHHLVLLLVIKSSSVNVVSLDWLLDSISCYKLVMKLLTVIILLYCFFSRMQSFDEYLVK